MGNAGGKRGGGNDRILESRHLIGLFLGVVLLCGVFFTLGWVMGHTQPGGGAVHAAGSPPRESASSTNPANASNQAPPGTPQAESPEWDFYPSKKPAEKPAATVPVTKTASQPVGPASVPRGISTPVSPPARYQPPRIPHGAIVLQLAALKSEADALALTDALQQKKFPAFVATPTSDSFYRVQVGPYADEQSANLAKQSLERAGFKVIIKH